jgi:xylitol oxidase
LLTRPGRPAGLVNWAGNVKFRAAGLRRPRSVAELQDVIARSTRVHALGSGHSFSRVADTEGVLVSAAALPPVAAIDPATATVTVGAGVTYGDLAGRLHAAGWALPSLASLPHLTVAGACATGTHGSGDRNGNLATAVRAMQLVTADGSLMTLRRDAGRDRFCGAVVSLGALGVVTALTLDLVPDFEVRQFVYEDLPAGQLTGHFAEIFASAYSVSVFTRWQGRHHEQVWLKHRTGDPDPPRPDRPWRGARPASAPRHPVPGMPGAAATEQGGVPGPWHERLPHFRPGDTPSSGEELQSEYLLPRDAAAAAFAAMARLGDVFAPVLLISEIRTVAADEAWLSPGYQRDTVAIHFTWIPDAGAVSPAIAAIERDLAPLGARPHWGKLFGLPPEAVAGRYPRWADFRALASTLDPAGKFRNDFLDTYFPRDP